jgi:hypothetical protein
LSAAEGFAGGPPPGEPTEEELRAAYEAELSRITTTDVIAQAAISMLNLGARRLAPPGEGPDEGAGEQDLEQVRDAIDASRALIEILERRIPADIPPLKDALSRLQMAYAKEVQRAPAAGGAPEPGGGGEPGAGGDSGAGGAPGRGDGPGAGGEGGPGAGGGAPGGQPPGQDPSHRPGPAESSGRLWVPGK